MLQVRAKLYEMIQKDLTLINTLYKFGSNKISGRYSSGDKSSNQPLRKANGPTGRVRIVENKIKNEPDDFYGRFELQFYRRTAGRTRYFCIRRVGARLTYRDSFI